MALKMILTGHGMYGSGMLSSLEFICGKQEHVKAVDFTDSITQEELTQTYEDLINDYSEDTVLFICDLVGGTPFKTAATLTNHLEHVQVVAGINIGALLEMVCSPNMETSLECAKSLLELSKKHIQMFRKINFN